MSLNKSLKNMGFRKNLKKGEVVFRENDPSDCAYIVGVGAIEICKKTPRGQKVLKVLGDNEIFGEMGLIDGLPRSATARARQDSVVYILTSLEQNLNVLTPAEFVFLENRKPDGVYNHETRKKLYGILAKLEREKPRSSRIEKRLYKFFRDANFGILLDKDSKTREKIIHSGKVHILARFEGEIIAQAVLIEKTASVAATIAAEVVMCKGKVFGEIRATYKLKIAKDAKVKGYVHTPNFIIEQGAVFDGRCSMPNIKRPGPLHRLKEVFRKTG